MRESYIRDPASLAEEAAAWYADYSGPYLAEPLKPDLEVRTWLADTVIPQIERDFPALAVDMGIFVEGSFAYDYYDQVLGLGRDPHTAGQHACTTGDGAAGGPGSPALLAKLWLARSRLARRILEPQTMARTAMKGATAPHRRGQGYDRSGT